MKEASKSPKFVSDLQSKAKLMASWFEGSACKCTNDDGNVRELKGASMQQKSKCKHDKKLKDELYLILENLSPKHMKAKLRLQQSASLLFPIFVDQTYK